MRQSKNERYIKAALAAFCVIAASIVFYYLVFHNSSFRTSLHKFFSILNPLIYGVIMAYILNPLMQMIENLIHSLLRRWKVTLNRTIHVVVRFFSAVASLLILFFIVYGLFSLLLPQLIESIRNIIRNYPVYEANVINWVNNTFGSKDVSQTTATILEYADRIYDWAVGRLPEVDSLVTNVTSYLFGFVRLILNFLIGIIIAIYILISKEMLSAKAKRMLYAFAPIRSANMILHNLKFVDEKFGGFIIGKVLDSAVIGVLCYISMQIMKMPYTELIAVIIGVTNIIPFFGPLIGAVPCAILVFVVSPLKSVYFIIFIILLQQFDGNILGPRILGNSTGLSGFMVIIAIVICNGLFGIGGAFFGVPLTATIVGIVQAYIRKNATKKNLVRDITFYDDLAFIDEQTLKPVLRREQAPGTSLYDRIKRQREDLRQDGLRRFMKQENDAVSSSSRLPEDDDVQISYEEYDEEENPSEKKSVSADGKALSSEKAEESSEGKDLSSEKAEESSEGKDLSSDKKDLFSVRKLRDSIESAKGSSLVKTLRDGAVSHEKKPVSHLSENTKKAAAIPIDPVNVTEEEAAHNHNLPLVP